MFADCDNLQEDGLKLQRILQEQDINTQDS